MSTGRPDAFRPSGIIAASVTPFRADESLDEDRLCPHVEFLVAAGIHGLVPIGGSGEYVSLSPDERRRVISLTVQAAAGRVPVIAGALAPSTREILEVGCYAARAGADALLVSPPYYIRPAARAFYGDALGLSFEGGEGDYVFTERLAGVKRLGLWPLREAAQACFGSPDWPGDVPLPQASLEFEVEDVEAVAAAAAELESRGYRPLHASRIEPWGQTITRLLSPDGLLIGLCYTPQFHAAASDARASSS